MLTILASWVLLTPQQVSAEEIYEKTTPSVLTLTVEHTTGSKTVGTAFLALKKGVAVTAWHVLKGAKVVTAKFSDGHEVRVTGVIDKNPVLDIAMIQLDTGERPILGIAYDDPRVGSRAYVIGSPKGMDFSISDGIISQTPMLGSDRLYQFTCPVSQGNSGGPLLNGSGQVLGVVSWQLRDAQNLNFAVPGKTLSQLDVTNTAQPLIEIEKEGSVLTDVLVAVTDDTLVEVFEKIDVPTVASDDGTGKNAYLFESAGTRISLFQYSKSEKPGPTVNLSLSTGYEAGAPSDLQRINDFNRNHRFVRSYRDANGVVYVENDLDIENGMGVAGVVRFVSRFMQAVGQFEAEVFERTDRKANMVIDHRPRQVSPGALTQIDSQQLTNLLKEIGHVPHPPDQGDPTNRVTFTINKTNVSLLMLQDKDSAQSTSSLTLSVGFETAHRVDLASVNTFNEQNRFSKAFLDDEGDPFLVSDLDLVGGVTKETLVAFVRTFERTLPKFEDMIGRR